MNPALQRRMRAVPPEVSVIIPVKNGAKFLPEAFEALLCQTAINAGISIEICIYDDGSEDDTWDIISKFAPMFERLGTTFRKDRGKSSGGVGYAKNRAVLMSSGRYLYFNDADDVSSPERILVQYRYAVSLDSQFIFLGSRFHRHPFDSTPRYSRWANEMEPHSLKMQIFTSNGPTLVAPTWFVSRNTYDLVKGFDESRKNGYPEDLDFFYRCLDHAEIKFHKVEADLVMYRYHPSCATLGVSEKVIWDIRIDRLKKGVIAKWDSFTVWSAGKQGKRFFKCLDANERSKVSAFCDVDASKIRRGWHEEFDENQRKVTSRVPIIHVKNARPPLIVCVKLGMTGGDLEEIIAKSSWVEGRDLVHFG